MSHGSPWDIDSSQKKSLTFEEAFAFYTGEKVIDLSKLRRERTGLEHSFEMHRRYSDPLISENTKLPPLMMTEFLVDNGRSANLCFVANDGTIDTACENYDHDFRKMRRTRLTNAETARLQAGLSELPLSTDLPPVADLLIISFSDGKTRATRFYDRKQLPIAVQNIYDFYRITDRDPGIKFAPRMARIAQARGVLGLKAQWPVGGELYLNWLNLSWDSQIPD